MPPKKPTTDEALDNLFPPIEPAVLDALPDGVKEEELGEPIELAEVVAAHGAQVASVISSFVQSLDVLASDADKLAELIGEDVALNAALHSPRERVRTIRAAL